MGLQVSFFFSQQGRSKGVGPVGGQDFLSRGIALGSVGPGRGAGTLGVGTSYLGMWMQMGVGENPHIGAWGHP